MSVRCQAKGGPASCTRPDCPERRAFMRTLPAAAPAVSSAEHAVATAPALLTAGALAPHVRAAVETYLAQMIEEDMAEPTETVEAYRYEVRAEPLGKFVAAYCEGDFADGYDAAEFQAHHAAVLAGASIPHHPEKNRWPVVVDDENPNYIDDGFHRFHAYVRAGASAIPTVRFHWVGAASAA